MERLVRKFTAKFTQQIVAVTKETNSEQKEKRFGIDESNAQN